MLVMKLWMMEEMCKMCRIKRNLCSTAHTSLEEIGRGKNVRGMLCMLGSRPGPNLGTKLEVVDLVVSDPKVQKRCTHDSEAGREGNGLECGRDLAGVQYTWMGWERSLRWA